MAARHFSAGLVWWVRWLAYVSRGRFHDDPIAAGAGGAPILSGSKSTLCALFLVETIGVDLSEHVLPYSADAETNERGACFFPGSRVIVCSLSRMTI